MLDFTWYKGWPNWKVNFCFQKKGNWAGNKPNALADAQCGHLPERSWTSDGWTVDSPDTNLHWTDDCDLLSVTPNTNKADCRKSCLNSPKCNHFTWLLGDNTNYKNLCILKQGQWPGKTNDFSDKAQCGRIPDRSLTTDGWTVDGDVTWKINCDFGGQDIQGITNPTPNINQEHCGKLCFDNPKCDHFTWYIGDNTNKNLCYLKSGVWTENRPNDLANAKCGFIPVRPWKKDGDVVWDENCSFAGQDVTSTPNTKKEDCGKLCFQNPQCSHFTWWVGDSSTNKDLCFLRQGYWPGNSPSDHATAQCGYIPGRSSWKVNRDKPGTPIWGSTCDFPENPSSQRLSRGKLTFDIDNIQDCAFKCYQYMNASPMTHFILSGNKCFLKSTKATGFTRFYGPVYDANAKCGYLKDRA